MIDHVTFAIHPIALKHYSWTEFFEMLDMHELEVPEAYRDKARWFRRPFDNVAVHIIVDDNAPLVAPDLLSHVCVKGLGNRIAELRESRWAEKLVGDRLYLCGPFGLRFEVRP